MNELQQALADALKPYITGTINTAKNPYHLPYVEQGLKVLGRSLGLSTFGSDWQDVLDKLDKPTREAN